MFVVSFVGNRGTFIRGYKAMVMDMEFLYHVGYILTSVLGLFAHELFYSILLFDLIYREETLFNVIKSVTRNGRSILLTALLALILVYLFSIVGFLFLKDDFILEVDRLPGNHSRGLGDFPSGVGMWGDNPHAQVAGGSTRQGMLVPPGSLPSSCWILGGLAYTNLHHHT